MKYTEARMGRVFVLRLEDGDIVHEAIESFARTHSIQAASIMILGGADSGSKLICGPELDRSFPVRPMELILSGVHEAAGVGTLFPDASGNPTLHLHLACGRMDAARTGCIRRGVKVWHIMEAVLIELAECNACRKLDEVTGFELLHLPEAG